jgi:hypothetical protein
LDNQLIGHQELFMDCQLINHSLMSLRKESNNLFCIWNLLGFASLLENGTLGTPGGAMYVWESLWKQCMFRNPWETMCVWESLGNNVPLGIPEETMYVWESLEKQCMFGNPLGNTVCLEIPWETMHVWESL